MLENYDARDGIGIDADAPGGVRALNRCIVFIPVGGSLALGRWSTRQPVT